MVISSRGKIDRKLMFAASAFSSIVALVVVMWLSGRTITSPAGDQTSANSYIDKEDQFLKSRIPFSGPDAEIFVLSGIGGPECAEFLKLDYCQFALKCNEKIAKLLDERLKEPGLTPERRFELMTRRANREWYLAERPDEAVRRFDEALREYREARSGAATRGRSPEATRVEWLGLTQAGVSWLRYGEVRNCVENHNADSCLFPLSRLAHHRRKEGAAKAAAYFEEALRIRETSHLIWLYSIAHQALGTPVEEVPKTWRLPKAALKTLGAGSLEDGLTRFEDWASPLGFQSRQDTGGANAQAQDFNGDGRLDLIQGGRNACSPIKLYWGIEEGFENAKLDPRHRTLTTANAVTNILSADVDNDGDLDLYLVRGGWVTTDSAPILHNELLLNDGKGRFTRSAQSPLNAKGNRSVAALFADFDLDGWIDLFVCDEVSGPELHQGSRKGFRRVSNNGGLSYQGVCKGTAAGDLDGDGQPELFIGLYGQDNQLYKNVSSAGEIRFQPIVNSPVLNRPQFAFPAAFADFNNDSHLDLFVGSFYRDTGNYARFVLGRDYKPEVSRIFLNDGQGQLIDRTDELGFANPAQTMGSGLADLNGDGWLDILLGTGSVSYGDLVPNLVYINRAGKAFVERGTELGMSSLQKGHGVVTADFDGDLRSDIFWVNGGTIPGDNYFPSLYRNSSTQNSWLGLELEGVTANRSAIGAKVEVEVEENREPRADSSSTSEQTDKPSLRRIVRHVGLHSSFGSESLRLNIGLGETKKIRRLSIHWPNRTRRVDSYTEGLEVGHSYRVREGEPPQAVSWPKANWPIRPSTGTPHHHHHE